MRPQRTFSKNVVLIPATVILLRGALPGLRSTQGYLQSSPESPIKDRLSPVVPVVVKIMGMVVLQCVNILYYFPGGKNAGLTQCFFVPIRSHYASTWKRPWNYDPSSNHIFPLLVVIAQDLLPLILTIPPIENKTTITMLKPNLKQGLIKS